MAAALDRTFDYDSLPLRLDVGQIRLLRLPKQTPKSRPMKCNLEVFSLADAPSYTALSYVWSDATDRLPLTCNNDGNVYITRNLNRALKYFRRKRPQWLWADAICINQADLEERRTQVLLMRRIYEQAKKTVIWLGKVDSVARSAMNLILALNSSRLKFKEAKETRTWFSMSEEYRVKYGLPTQRSADWSSFGSLDTFLSSGWFSRLWTIQELAVSRRPVMVAKHFGMSWKDFAATMMFSDKLGMPMWVYGDSVARLTTLHVTRDLVQRKLELPLLQLLVTTSGLSATDPRDKIYALLGISGGLGREIQPDYTISVQELYVVFAHRLLKETNYLTILNVPHLPHDPLSSLSEATTESRLPSWVPNWQGEVSSRQWPFIDSNFTTLPVTYGSSPSAQFRFFNNFTAAPKVSDAGGERNTYVEANLLRLRGLRLSPIEAMSLEHGSFVRASGAMGKWEAYGTEAAVFRADEQVCNIHWFKKPYPRTGETMRDVYWQTLCAGQHFVSYADTKAGFEKWFSTVHPIFHFVPAPSHPWLVTLNAYFINLLFILLPKQVQKDMWAQRDADDYRHFQYATAYSTSGRRMFRTEDQCIGLGPPNMDKGDIVFLVKGCRTPMPLRPTERPEQWTLIGACYLHGFMNGDAVEEERCIDIWLA